MYRLLLCGIALAAMASAAAAQSSTSGSTPTQTQLSPNKLEVGNGVTLNGPTLQPTGIAPSGNLEPLCVAGASCGGSPIAILSDGGNGAPVIQTPGATASPTVGTQLNQTTTVPVNGVISMKNRIFEAQCVNSPNCNVFPGQ